LLQQTPSMQNVLRHSAPAEQAVPLALSVAQRPPLHATPEPVQVPPAPPQHGWPLAPHAQMPDEQLRFELHVPAPPPEQQA
jgi:hypothetical protein